LGAGGWVVVTAGGGAGTGAGAIVVVVVVVVVVGSAGGSLVPVGAFCPQLVPSAPAATMAAAPAIRRQFETMDMETPSSDPVHSVTGNGEDGPKDPDP
jgi:hypothetical protein